MGDGLSSVKVSNYLKSNCSFLEQHVLEHVDVETLERWLIRRSQRDTALPQQNSQEVAVKISLSRWKVHLVHNRLHNTYMVNG